MPLVGSAPVQLPDAVHALVFVDVQLNIEVPPLVTVVGDAVRLTVGTGCVTVKLALAVLLVPPVPVQVS